MIGSQYDADYFLRGKETGKSLYSDYRWLPELTVPMVCAMVSHLGIAPEDTILDFGCARGYTVKAFRQEGYNAFGCDISKWAIDNCDPSVKDYLHPLSWGWDYTKPIDWIIAKDVLEHVDSLMLTVDTIMNARKGVFAVVPLAHNKRTGSHGDTIECRYDVIDYELDATHIHRRPLQWWVGQFHRPGWAVTGQYRVRGIKDNYAHYPTGNGFITARRIGD